MKNGAKPIRLWAKKIKDPALRKEFLEKGRNLEQIVYSLAEAIDFGIKWDDGKWETLWRESFEEFPLTIKDPITNKPITITIKQTNSRTYGVKRCLNSNKLSLGGTCPKFELLQTIKNRLRHIRNNGLAIGGVVIKPETLRKIRQANG